MQLHVRRISRLYLRELVRAQQVIDARARWAARLDVVSRDSGHWDGEEVRKQHLELQQAFRHAHQYEIGGEEALGLVHRRVLARRDVPVLQVVVPSDAAESDPLV